MGKDDEKDRVSKWWYLAGGVTIAPGACVATYYLQVKGFNLFVALLAFVSAFAAVYDLSEFWEIHQKEKAAVSERNEFLRRVLPDALEFANAQSRARTAAEKAVGGRVNVGSGDVGGDDGGEAEVRGNVGNAFRR